MSSVLGIDVSSHAIDLVKLDEETTSALWLRVPLDGATSFDRLRQIPLAMPHGSFYDNVYLAAIERPKTRFMPSAAALFPVFGAVVACLPAALELWDVPPTAWRHGLGLKGNAKKEECALKVIRLLQIGDDGILTLNWPQDAYDAYAIAFYARELNSRGIALDQAREKQLTVI